MSLLLALMFLNDVRIIEDFHAQVNQATLVLSGQISIMVLPNEDMIMGANTAQGNIPSEQKHRPFKVSIKKIASDEMVIEDETVVLQQVVKIRIHEAEFRLHVDRLTNEGIYFTLIRLFEP